MSFLYGLKLVCDLCFYFTFANLICMLFELGSLLFSLPFFAVTAFAGSFLMNKKVLRFVPMVLFIPLFYYAQLNLIGYLFLIPPCLYIAYSLYNPIPDLNGMMYAEIFSLYLKIIIVVVIFALLGLSEQTQVGIFSFSVVFILGSIILMRMARHDKEVLEQTRFKIINSISVISITALVLIISNKDFLTGVLSLIMNIYRLIIAPVLDFILTAVVYILWHAFIKYLKPLTEFHSLDIQEGVNLGGEDPAEVASEAIMNTTFHPLAIALLYLAIFSIAAFIVYRLFKRLRNTYFSPTGGKGAYEKHTALGEGKAKNKSQLPKEVNQIRQIYRKFLEVCKSAGIVLSLSATSQEIALKSGEFFREEENAKRLREIYIDARYGEKEFDKSKIKECKDIYNKFKNKK